MNLPLINENNQFLSSNPILKNKLSTLVTENEIFEKHFKNKIPISTADLNRYEQASEELKREMMNIYKANNFNFPNDTPVSLQSTFSYFHFIPESEF